MKHPGSLARAVTSDIVQGRLRTVVDEMARLVANTCYSARMSVRHRLAARLSIPPNVAAADYPSHIASLEATTKYCADAFRFDPAEDEVILTNDPHGGSPSVRCFTVGAPVEAKGQINGYVAARAHVPDTGGMVMGNYDPTARELRTEGTRLSPMQMNRFGRRRRDIIEMLCLNGRESETFGGELNRVLVALGRGQREVSVLNAFHGGAVLRIESPGGGGYGDPRDRRACSPEANLTDGLVSPGEAQRAYGRHASRLDVSPALFALMGRPATDD